LTARIGAGVRFGADGGGTPPLQTAMQHRDGFISIILGTPAPAPRNTWQPWRLIGPSNTADMRPQHTGFPNFP
jgi:hypothetical protein